MAMDLSRLGQWTERVFHVRAERIKAYAAAINDRDPQHAAGEVAPPVFAVVPGAEIIDPSLDGLVSPEDQRWGLHSAQDMRFYLPILPGMALHTRGATIGIHPRRNGTAVIIKAETRNVGGILLSETYLTLLIRRVLVTGDHGVRAPDHELRPSVKATPRIASVADTIDPDQTYRYAEASGDANRIHLDPEYARSVGLPGIIVHGMCTMAFAGRAVMATACRDESTRLRRLAARFARPVFPGQAITTNIWATGERDGLRVYGFETVNPDGKAVLHDGLAEVMA